MFNSGNNVEYVKAIRDLYGGRGGKTKLFSKDAVYKLERVGKKSRIIKDDIDNIRVYEDIIKDKRVKGLFVEVSVEDLQENC